MSERRWRGDDDRTTGGVLVSPGSMFFSAAIAGFFGFFMLSGTQPTMTYQVVVWTFRGAAIGFALAGLLTQLRGPIGVAVYLMVSAVTAAALGIAGALILIANGFDINGLLFLFLAFWNGSGTWQAFQTWKRQRGAGIG